MPDINGEVVHIDCLHFRGDIPCRPNKEQGYLCNGCPVYTQVEKRILIIKLGAIGDVIRTTPLLRRIRAEYPNAKITWLTHTPAILPRHAVEEILKFDLAAILYLQNTSFDILYNLDKDKEACALYNSIRAEVKYGYQLENGVAFPANELAHHKYLTGVFDQVSLANRKSYVEEIFEICGWNFQGEEYIFDNHQDKGYQWTLDRSKPLIGLNTGCGDRWTTRLWSDEKWVALIGLLQQQNYQVVLLGGEQEHARNQQLSTLTGATYFGYFKLEQFINLMHQMDVIVTQVTMAMHIAIALQKKIVLMNNIFNPYEFELYGRGAIVQPDKECTCFYRGSCRYGVSCMEELPAEKVFRQVQACLNANQPADPAAG
jgi:ADP-heptose:LPS heptosyltransferase